MGWLDAFLLGPKHAVTRPSALLGLHVLKELEPAVLDRVHSYEVSAKVGNDDEDTSRVNDSLMREGSRLAIWVDGRVIVGKCAGLCEGAVVGAECVDAVTATAGGVSMRGM